MLHVCVCGQLQMLDRQLGYSLNEVFLKKPIMCPVFVYQSQDVVSPTSSTTSSIDHFVSACSAGLSIR